MQYGGAELQFFLLSRELAADQAFDVSVLTTVDSDAGREQVGPLTIIKRQAGGRYAQSRRGARKRFPTALPGWAAAFWEMYCLFRRIDADVYLHAGAGVEVGAYALICRLLGRRFVYVVSSSADLCRPDGNVQGTLRWLFPLGLRMANVVVARTHQQLEWLRTRHGRNGVLIRTAHPADRRCLDDAAIKAKESVLWVGRIAPVKQPGLFLDLAERLADQQCTMIAMQARGQHELFEDLRARAATLANVTLMEDVPWSELGRFFIRAKVLVNTSEYEGFPNTFVEAAMRGTPILSLLVDPDGILAERGIGFCAAGSMERLIRFGEQLCRSPELTAQLGRRALMYALHHHDLHRAVGDLKALIRSLIGTKVGTRAAPEAA